MQWKNELQQTSTKNVDRWYLSGPGQNLRNMRYLTRLSNELHISIWGELEIKSNVTYMMYRFRAIKLNVYFMC